MTENKLQDQCYDWSAKDLAGDSEWTEPINGREQSLMSIIYMIF